MKKNKLKYFGKLLIVALLFSACSNNDDTPEENLVLEIGQEYQGGIIFYLDDTQEHGLIAYQSDLAEAAWGCFHQPNPIPPTAPIAQNDGIGYGAQNTLAIINFCDESDSAASLSFDLNANGFNDWYLPSIEELALIYENRDLIGGFPDLNNDPNEAYIMYASSSEGWGTNDGNGGFLYLNYQVYDFSMTTAFPDDRTLYTGKDNKMIVRPIRSF
ncbi:hypothetical protein [Aequorivita sp. CIP111184]|uniref:hypothetical protein n=1 Tax=Aequorivita sp. CIP111184 TaxID=2211356 RepID=UPI000DBBE5F7|nr:hypothetical protein [Aequorivita sp. CIP111184]SRX54520.1 hypothetical protein AEQU1_01531 [Aequorivita sp. CIP111184]